MIFFNKRTLLSINFFIFFLFCSVSFSQELSVGTDVVNRYIWRGLKLGGESPSIQPNVALSAGNFSVGFWGAYPFDPNILEEIDFYANYTIPIDEAGEFNLGFTDYINPNSGTPIFNFHNYNSDKGPGAHFLEVNANYAGPESFPIQLSFNIFVYNLEHNPIYFQLGYSTSVNDIGLDLFVGGSPGEANGYYGITDFDVINVGFKASKSIAISDKFSLPIFGSIIANPSIDAMYYVFGVQF